MTAGRATDTGLRIAFLAAVYGPVAALAVAMLAGPVSASSLALPGAARWALLARSVALSGSVAFAATAVGFLVASRVSEGRPALRTAGWMTLALAAVPPYVHAQAWSAVAVLVGRGAASEGLATPAFRGVFAALLVETSAFLPLAVGLGLAAVASVPHHLVDAARVTRGDAAALLRVTIPLSMPMLGAGAGLIFLLSLLDYSVPALYQVNVFSLAIFTQYSATNRAGGAAIYALPLVLVAAAAVIATQSRLRAVAGRSPGPRGIARPLGLPRWLRGLRAAGWIVAVPMLVVPPAVLVHDVGDLGTLRSTLAPARPDLLFSFLISFAAALAVLPLAWPVARALSGKRSRLWWLAVTLPLSIPAPLVGIGLIHQWNREGLRLYGTSAMPVLAAVARFAPVAALVLVAHGRRIDRTLVDAARVHERSALQGWLRVVAPMWLPGLLAAAAVTFVLTLGELGATLIVAPPGHATLTMRIFNYLHYGASDTVASLSLVVGALTALGGLAGIAALRTWGRLAR